MATVRKEDERPTFKPTDYVKVWQRNSLGERMPQSQLGLIYKLDGSSAMVTCFEANCNYRIELKDLEHWDG